MYKVYGDRLSGNCYKVKLMLELLGLAYEWVEVDILKGETQTEAFLAMNPNGKIPVLELDDGTMLAESDAILWYLGEGTDFIPSDPVVRAQMLGWMFWEQYNHEPVIAVRQALVTAVGAVRV